MSRSYQAKPRRRGLIKKDNTFRSPVIVIALLISPYYSTQTYCFSVTSLKMTVFIPHVYQIHECLFRIQEKLHMHDEAPPGLMVDKPMALVQGEKRDSL